MAIAHHQAPEADRLLETLAAASQPLELRKQAAFWMGTARGRTGYETLRCLVREDTNEKLRANITFALSQSQEPDAILTLIQTAREDASARVRGQLSSRWLRRLDGGQPKRLQLRLIRTRKPR